MSGSSERPPTKTTNPSTTEHISPAHPRVPAVTVKHPHPGRGGGGDGGAARKSTARTEEPTMAAGCNPAEETRNCSAAFEGGPKTARPTLRSLDRTRQPTSGRSQRPHCDRRQLLPFRGWGRQRWWTFGTLRLSSGRGGWGLARNLQEGCHISTNRSRQGWTSGACGNVMAPTE